MESIYKINTSENKPMLRLSTIEDILRDQTIINAEKAGVLKCYKYVKQWVEWSGDEPINGNTCITVDGVYRAIKIHANQTISHVKILTGQRNNYVKLQISPQVTP
jgi:hypothetical protein